MKVITPNIYPLSENYPSFILKLEARPQLSDFVELIQQVKRFAKNKEYEILGPQY